MNISIWSISDYSDCKNISDAFNESTPTKEVFQELIRNDQLYVIKINNIIVWFISYKLLWNESIFLQFLRVHKDYHRKWIATKLMQYIEDISKERGAYEVFSTILVENTASKRLHENRGYKLSGEITFDSWKELVYLKVL